MAEEWGTVLVRVSAENSSAFDKAGEVADLAARVAAAGGISSDKIAGLNLRTQSVHVRDGFVAIEYDCADWRAFSEVFVAVGDGVEFYARTLDEYGAAGFFALPETGERFSFSYDQDGDMFDVEGYEEEVQTKIDEWISLLPDDLKAHFPGFIDEEDESPFADWPPTAELTAGSVSDGHEILGFWHSRDREIVLQFTADLRAITFELYSKPETMTYEWLAEDRIKVDGHEAAIRIENDQLDLTFNDGRTETLSRVNTPKVLRSDDN